MEDRKNSVYKITKLILFKLDSILDKPAGKALLANLRNSIGKPLSETVDIWPLVFENLPDEYIGRGPDPTNEEIAIITTLQMYALHQQGSDRSVILKVNSGDKERYYSNIGYSFNVLREDKENEAIDRRFNALITSDTFEELSHHLRQMISLFKSKSNEKINYPLLSEDLYKFLKGNKESVRLNWARRYYRISNKDNKEKEINLNE